MNLLILLAVCGQPEPKFFDPVPVSVPAPKFAAEPKPAPTKAPAVAKVAAPGWHVHRCPNGHEWSHPDTSFGREDEHTCPVCKAVLSRPWWPTERGVRFVEPKTTPTYADVIARVKAGERLTLAIGVRDKADVRLDRVPETEPGLWRCYLRDGVPFMEQVRPSDERFVFVTASWCGPCQLMKAVELPALRQTYRVDVVEGKAAMPYAPAEYPTIVFERDGREVWRTTGYTTAAALIARAKSP